jgi:hypothetical protein
MSDNQNCAEAMDLMNSRIALGLLMASLTYALDASMYLLSDSNNPVIEWLGFSISILAALWIFRAVGPMLLKKLKSRRFSHQEPESFITESFHKAIIKSWIFTILVLMVLKVLESIIERVDLPVEFYLNGLVFIMLFSASGVFLLMTHISDDDDQPEDMIE